MVVPRRAFRHQRTVSALDNAKPRARFEKDEIIASKTAGWTFQDETGWLLEATIITVEAIIQAIESRIAAIASQGVFRNPARQDCERVG